MEWAVAIGVDTHRDVHVAVAVDRLGVQMDSREIETTREGYCSLLSWALELGVPAFAVEGAGAMRLALSVFWSVLAWRCTSVSGRVVRSAAVVRAI
jgi:transposase